ncbi:MAG TPA: acyl-ACP thioesterase domain-containing protein [Candidatus Limnocylindrales bacterium]
MSDPADGSAVASDGEPVLADTMPYRIVRPYRVRFEESTANETMRTAVYLAWAADVAWQHSTVLGFGREWYAERGLFWLVRAVRLDVLRPIETYASVFVGTRVYGYRRIAARRDCDVRDATGELLARLQVDWVMTNGRGVPTRVPDEMFALVTADAPTFELLKVSLPATPRGAFERRVSIARRDLDPLDHVNNSVYVDYLEEALAAAGADELLVAAPRRYDVDFVSSAGRGDVLVGRAWPHEGGWAYRLSRDDGTEIFRAKVARLREP